MDMGKLMAQAAKMQKEMAQRQKDLEETVFEAETAGGACKVKIRGNYKVESITLEKDAIDSADPEMLEDIIKSAVNLALEKIRKASDRIASDMQSSLRGV